MTTPRALAAAQRIADTALEKLPKSILRASGRALYSPADTLTSGSSIYFLGLNPGEDQAGSESHNRFTVRSDLQRLRDGNIDQHGYLDESWKGNAPGDAPIQKRAQQLFTILLDCDARAGKELLRKTPTSNLILRRSSSAAQLEAKTGKRAVDLAIKCWPFHRAVIAECKCEVVLTHAITVARGLARHWRLGPCSRRPSGWGGSFRWLYAWELPEGPRLLAIPNLSRYKPDKQRAKALRAFFRKFGPKFARR